MCNKMRTAVMIADTENKVRSFTLQRYKLEYFYSWNRLIKKTDVFSNDLAMLVKHNWDKFDFWEEIKFYKTIYIRVSKILLYISPGSLLAHHSWRIRYIIVPSLCNPNHGTINLLIPDHHLIALSVKMLQEGILGSTEHHLLDSWKILTSKEQQPGLHLNVSWSPITNYQFILE